MIRLGNFFFRYRNLVFPLVFTLMVLGEWLPVAKSDGLQILLLFIGFVVSLVGQGTRALTIGLDYIRRGGKKKAVYADDLVQTGIFAHCRNPLYLGNGLMIAGIGIMSNSVPFFLIGVPFFIIAYWSIILAEENFLSDKFGEEYTNYCAKVPRILPRMEGLAETVKSMQFHWKRLIVKEYQTFYIWGLGAAFFLIRYQQTHRDPAADSAPFLNFLWTGVVIWTVLFLIAWGLKKTRRLRPD